MPATLQTIRGKTATITVYLGDPDVPESERDPDDSFTVTYRKHNMTAKIEQLAREAEKDGRVFESLCDLAVPVLVEWDLRPGASEDLMEELERARAGGDQRRIAKIEEKIRAEIEKQSPIPITKENLAEYVPSSVLILTLRAIGDSQNPNSNGTGPQ